MEGTVSIEAEQIARSDGYLLTRSIRLINSKQHRDSYVWEHQSNGPKDYQCDCRWCPFHSRPTLVIATTFNSSCMVDWRRSCHFSFLVL